MSMFSTEQGQAKISLSPLRLQLLPCVWTPSTRLGAAIRASLQSSTISSVYELQPPAWSFFTDSHASARPRESLLSSRGPTVTIWGDAKQFVAGFSFPPSLSQFRTELGQDNGVG